MYLRHYQVLVLLLVVGLTGHTFAGENTAVDTSEFEKPVKLACIGDSITYGSGIKQRTKNHYPAQLGHWLGDKWRVRNFGVSGATLLRDGDKPYPKQKLYEQALKWQPDIAVIMLGTNDSKLQNWGEHANAFVCDYQTLIESFRDTNTDMRI